LIAWLDQLVLNADPAHAKALLATRLVAPRGRPSPHQTSGASLVALSGGAVYP
jgi:hypothetical protein